MTQATSTTQDSCSKSTRNAQPAKTAAQSFAKFAASPQSSRLKTSASSANAIVAASSPARCDQSGSASRTSRSVAGMTATETIAIAGHSPTRGQVRRHDEPRERRTRRAATKRRDAPPALVRR